MTGHSERFQMTINGLVTEVFYPQKTIDTVFLPLLQHWTALWQKKKSRIIVYLAAPPGVGKTTTALFLEQLSQQTEGIHPIQAIGLDGFHYHQDYILSHTLCVDGHEVPMKDLKGCPETFDVEKLHQKLSALITGDIKWPIYDRTRHDVIEDHLSITGDIILLEGNWLLLNEGRWAELTTYCDDTVFVEAQAELLKERLIQRKIQGGLTLSAAQDFYERSDSKNIARVLNCRRESNIRLRMETDQSYTMLS